MKRFFSVSDIKKFITKLMDDDVCLTSAALSYYMFFSFFPVIIVISILFGRALEFESLRIIAENLEALLPKEIMGIINNYIDFAVSESGDNVLYISVFFTFYFPLRAVSKLMEAINKAYTGERKRKGLKKYLYAVILGIGIYILIVLAIIVVLIGERAIEFIVSALVLPDWIVSIWTWGKFILLWIVSTASVLLLHIFSVIERKSLKYMVYGSILSTFLWTVVSALFSFYVKNIGRYSLLFGSLSAVIVLLYWLFLTSAILISGAEFSALCINKKGENKK